MTTGAEIQQEVAEAIASLTARQCLAISLVHGAETMATFGAELTQRRFEDACQALADRRDRAGASD